VQHEPLRALAFRAEKALQLQLSMQIRPCNESRLSLEGNARELGVDLAFRARFGLFRFVLNAEFDCGNARGRVTQCAQLDQLALDL
jgi:hypothetical protein